MIRAGTHWKSRGHFGYSSKKKLLLVKPPKTFFIVSCRKLKMARSKGEKLAAKAYAGVVAVIKAVGKSWAAWGHLSVTERAGASVVKKR